MKLLDLIPEHVQKLPLYQPGKPVDELERELGISGALKIASNENPFGPSPRAMEAARAALAQAHVYPDDGYHRLRKQLAAHLDVDPSWLVIGAGSNELIHLLPAALCRPETDEVLTHAAGFISYRLAAANARVPFVETPVDAEMRCDVDALIARMSAKTRLIFLGHPNNPTGSALSATDLQRLIAAKPASSFLVVDEAYFEYARVADPGYRSALGDVAKVPGLIVLRTFSKAYGLASLRVGYGIMHPDIAGYVQRVRRAFNVSSIAEAAAVAALGDDEHVRRSAEAAHSSIAIVRAAASKLGLHAFPSVTNFVLIDLGGDEQAKKAYGALLHAGIIVRPMATWGLPRCLRLSVGTPEQTARAVAALESVVGA